MTALDVTLRAYRETDRNLVLVTYLRSFADSLFARQVGSRPVYFKGQEKLARERLLPASVPIMACLAEDDDAVVGWMLRGHPDNTVLHYVYVKPPFRRMGVGAKLVGWSEDDEPLRYSHLTAVCESLPIPKSWQYDPYPMINAGT